MSALLVNLRHKEVGTDELARRTYQSPGAFLSFFQAVRHVGCRHSKRESGARTQPYRALLLLPKYLP